MIEKKCENCRRFFNCSNEPERLEICFFPDEPAIRKDERVKIVKEYSDKTPTTIELKKELEKECGDGIKQILDYLYNKKTPYTKIEITQSEILIYDLDFCFDNELRD